MPPSLLRVIFERDEKSRPLRYAEIIFNKDGGVVDDVFVRRGVYLCKIRRVDAVKIDIAVKRFWERYFPYRLLCGYGTGYGDE